MTSETADEVDRRGTVRFPLETVVSERGERDGRGNGVFLPTKMCVRDPDIGDETSV